MIDSLPHLANLLWIEELPPSETSVVQKRGGRGYYLDDAFILRLVEIAKIASNTDTDHYIRSISIHQRAACWVC